MKKVKKGLALLIVLATLMACLPPAVFALDTLREDPEPYSSVDRQATILAQEQSDEGSLVTTEESPTEPVKLVPSVIATVQISSGADYICIPISLTIDPDSAEVVFSEDRTAAESVTGFDALVEGVYYSLYSKDLDPATITAEEIELTKYTLGKTSQAGWLDGVFDLANTADCSWMYAVDEVSPMVSCADYELKGGETVWFYYCDWTMGYRGYAKDNGDNTISLYGVPVCDEMYGTYKEIPVEGWVTIDGQTFKANTDGIITVTGTPGTYTLQASWEEDEYGWEWQEPYFTFTLRKTGSSDNQQTQPTTPSEGTDTGSTQPPTNQTGSKPAVNVPEIKAALSTVWQSKVVSNSSTEDIDCFWPMLAKSSLLGITPANIDFTSLDYSAMTAQQLGKVLITMANNGYDPKTVLYQGNSIVDLLVSYQQADGSFNNINLVNKKGDPATIYATDQVWDLIALEIVDADYNREAGLSYLAKWQNADGGYGYQSYSDVGTSSWVLSLQQLLPTRATTDPAILAYINSSWPGLVSSNDSSSMSAFISTGLATEEQISQFLATSYNAQGQYFTWGTESDKENSYATATSVQALGDLDGSIYQHLDDYCVVTYDSGSNSDPGTTPPDSGSNTEGSTNLSKPEEPVTPTKPIEVYGLTLSFPGFNRSYTFNLEKGSTAYDVVVAGLKQEGLSYSASNGYIAWVRVNGDKIGYGWDDSGLDGLMYRVNGTKPSVGLKDYTLKAGDTVSFYYTEDYTKEDTDSWSPSTKPDTSTNPGTPTTPAKPNPDTGVPVKGNGIGNKDLILNEVASSSTKHFKDIEGHWAQKNIVICQQNGWMSGYSAENFGPNDTLTRAQFMQALYNLFGDNEQYQQAFLDNPTGAWYSKALNWAAANKIAGGYTDGRFGVNDSITRQDMAVILARLLQPTVQRETPYADDSGISAYAKDAVYQLSELGLLSGVGDNSFAPKETFSRAQCATVIARLADILTAEEAA